MKKKQVVNMVETALCIAIGVALPQLLHSIPQVGVIFLPMHIPVLLCGLICGWQWGLVSGLITPALSSLFFGMPPIVYLPGMMLELAIYGLIAGILYRELKLNVYLSLVLAMLAGRIAGGLLQASLMASAGEAYSFSIFASAYFIKGLPGIIIQIILIPILVFSLQKAKLNTDPKRNI